MKCYNDIGWFLLWILGNDQEEESYQKSFSYADRFATWFHSFYQHIKTNPCNLHLNLPQNLSPLISNYLKKWNYFRETVYLYMYPINNKNCFVT